MRMIDWSSDGCSPDLPASPRTGRTIGAGTAPTERFTAKGRRISDTVLDAGERAIRTAPNAHLPSSSASLIATSTVITCEPPLVRVKLAGLTVTLNPAGTPSTVATQVPAPPP